MSFLDILFGLFGLVSVISVLIHLYTNKAIPPKSKLCLVGKTAIVTGANRGIGYEIALGLAQRGCKVIIACRSNLEETKRKIIDETNNTKILAEYLDLLSFKTVIDFANKINQTEQRLDILIHNAGVLSIPMTFTIDGLNSMMQINHFSPFLLTHLLVELLKKTSPSRVIFLSSFLAFTHDLTVDNLNHADVPLTCRNILRVYGNSKLCNIISAEGFTRRLQRYEISVNAVHPGVVHTSIFTQLGDPDKSFVKLFYALFVTLFSKSPEEGAYPIIEAAIHETYQKISGKLLYGRGIFLKPWRIIRNSEFCEKIWKASEEYAKLRPDQRL